MFRKWQYLRKNSKGFTLIELMIVVAIIAILAAIAIPQYRKFQLKAKTSEAKTNLGAIRTCEEAYAADNDYYLNAGEYGNTSHTSSPANWPSNAGTFDKLGFHPQGKVYYGYKVNALTNATGNNVSVTDGKADIDIIAKGDLDGDGNLGKFHCNDENPKIIDDAPGKF